MSQRPKDIGTAHTTAVIRYLRLNGFPHAELRNQAGAHDRGDIVGTPGICWECKGGRAAENASDGQVADWMAETERERVYARADIGVLVLKRKAIGGTRAGLYWAVVPAGFFHGVTVGPPVRMHLAELVNLLRARGYGDPLGGRAHHDGNRVPCACHLDDHKPEGTT